MAKITNQEILDSFDDRWYKSVKQTVKAASDVDGDETFRCKLLNFIRNKSDLDDAEVFTELMPMIRYLIPHETWKLGSGTIVNDEHIAFTTPDVHIFMNTDNKSITSSFAGWNFIYQHEVMHQMWNTFKIEKKVEEKLGSCDPWLMNIASDTVINYFLVYRKKIVKREELAGGCFPDNISKDFGVEFDPIYETQYSFYVKLLNSDKYKKMSKDALEQWAKDHDVDDPFEGKGKLKPKSVDTQDTGGGGGGPQEKHSPDYIKGWTDAINEVLDNGIEAGEKKMADVFAESKNGKVSEDYAKGFGDAIGQIKKGLEEGIKLSKNNDGGEQQSNNSDLPQIPWDTPPQEGQGSSGKSEKSDNQESNDQQPQNADDAQKAADQAQQDANEASAAAKQAQKQANSGNGSQKKADQAQEAAEKAQEAADKAQAAADKAKSAAASGDSDAEKEAAAEAGEAASDASSAAEDAKDAAGMGSNSPSETSADAQNHAAAAAAAADAAQEAADKAKESGSKGDAEQAQEAADAAKEAAKEAQKAAEKAAQAAKDGNAEKEAEAAQEAKDAALKAKDSKTLAQSIANKKEDAGKAGTSGSSIGGNQPGGKGDPSTPVQEQIYQEEDSSVGEACRRALANATKTISGILGEFNKRCKKSTECNPDGLKVKVQKAAAWNEDTLAEMEGYIKQRATAIQRQKKNTYKKWRRGQGVWRSGEMVKPGRRIIDDKLSITIAFYIDISGSMGGRLNRVWDAMYDMVKAIKSRFGRNPVLTIDEDSKAFKVIAWDDDFVPLAFGKRCSDRGGTMSAQDLFNGIAKRTPDCLINIILTDGGFSGADIGACKKFLDNYEGGLLIMIQNQDDATWANLARDRKYSDKFRYIAADEEFRLKNDK